MRRYNVANKDETAFYSSGYGSRCEAEELLRISKRHDPDAHVVEYEVETRLERMDRERAELLAKIPRWINVEERLPEVRVENSCFAHTDVVLATAGEYILMGYFNIYKYDGSWKFVGMDNEMDYTDCASAVTHWMPLPEPPKENMHAAE